MTFISFLTSINAIPENRLLLESDLTDVLEIEDALREAASIVAQAKCWTDSAHAATFGSSSSSSSTTPTTTSADQDKTSATTTIDAVGINRVIELSNRNTNSFYAMNSVREDGTVDVLPLQAIPFVMDKWFQARLEYKEEVENATL